MKRKTFFLTLMLIGMMACSGNAKKPADAEGQVAVASQANVAADDYLKAGAVWHNGVEWFQIRKDGDVFAFIGGTLHEGGACFGLRANGANSFSVVPVKWSVDAGDYEPSLSVMNLYGENPGDLSAELRNYDGAAVLLLRHKTKGLRTVLLPAKGNGMEALDNTLKADMARAFTGTWLSSSGERYVFGADQSYTFPGKKGKYTFEYEFDSPAYTISLQDGSHWSVDAKDGRMILSEVSFDEENDGWTAVPGGKKISLTLENQSQWRFPFASTEPLTVGMLCNYGKEDLRIMRNEIWARHGYRFNSPDLQQRFSRIQGYTPVSDNSKVRLSPLEQLNVEIIKLVEESPND